MYVAGYRPLSASIWIEARIGELGAKLARQADAALGSCCGADVDLLNLGLLSMKQDAVQAGTHQTKMRKHLESCGNDGMYNVSYEQKLDGISRNRVAGPVLTIILTCEWLLAAATVAEPVAGTPTVEALEKFIICEPNTVALQLKRMQVGNGHDPNL